MFLLIETLKEILNEIITPYFPRNEDVSPNMDFSVFDPSSWEHGFHPPWRQGT